MIRKALTVAILLFAASFTNAADITVVENPVPNNSFAEASVKLADGQSVVWSIVPEPTKAVETNEIVYFNGPPGDYKVTAVIFFIEKEKVKTKKYTQKITIGTAPIPPPKPPAPPSPTDDLYKALQSAFDLELAAEKGISTQKLAAIYKVASDKTANDPNIKTYGQLFDVMKEASRQLLAETAIPKVRAVVGARLNPIFGAASSPIDRVKVAAEFKAVADALNAVK